MDGMGLNGMKGQAPVEQPIDDGEVPNVSPDEQKMYEMAVLNAFAIIYAGDSEKKPAPKVIEALGASDNPMMNLASAAVSIVMYLSENAAERGVEIDDSILYHVGVAVVEELAAIAAKEGIHDFSEQEIEQAFYQALDMYRTAGAESGLVDEEQLKQGFETIRQADAEGRLGEVLPGIESRMKEQG